ncbi:mariner transposase [Trichonephila clavipes]|nr:mariner transposase [Trichonephila clavipes]
MKQFMSPRGSRFCFFRSRFSSLGDNGKENSSCRYLPRSIPHTFYMFEGPGSNPVEEMDVCKCVVPLRHRGTLNIRLAASPLVCLVEEEESLSPTNIKTELDSTLGESTPSLTTVKYWIAEFIYKRGCMSCQDKHRSGQPNEVMTPEMEKKIHKVVLDDRRLKVRELADIVGI